jgi:hypothetical protein
MKRSPYSSFSQSIGKLIALLVFCLLSACLRVDSGAPLSPAGIDEQTVRKKLNGTFSARGQKIKNVLYGRLSGQTEYSDFTNWTYHISLSPTDSAMTVVESKEGDYGGIHLPGGVSMRKTSYDLGKTSVKIGGQEIEVWSITFSDTPTGFPEDELIVCEDGFRTIKDVFGQYHFTKRDGKVLTSREEVAKYFGINSR